MLNPTVILIPAAALALAVSLAGLLKSRRSEAPVPATEPEHPSRARSDG